MVRFFSLCLLLAALSAGAIVYFAPHLIHIPKDGDEPGIVFDEAKGSRKSTEPSTEPENGKEQSPATRSVADQREVTVTEVKAVGLAQPLIIQGARVLPLERVEVPSERDGKLLFLATPVSDDEWVPKDKEIRREMPLLGVRWKDGDDLRQDPDKKTVIKEPFQDPEAPGTYYRFPRQGDTLQPGTTKVIRIRLRFRKLAENDEVQEGQLLGIINPAMAIADMAAKESSVQAAAADVRASASMKEESKRRLAAIVKARSAVRLSVTDDDWGAAVVTVERYVNEQVAKEAAVVKSQQELSGAWTVLELHVIRAPIAGKIRTIYRQPGEAVKNLDNVLQVQNTRKLRVEAQVEVQDALPLHERMKRAEALRAEARRNAKKNPATAAALLEKAEKMIAVKVELTRPTPPKSVLVGHHQDVTCVAVSKGPLTRIASGSEDGTARLWERVAGEDRWQQKFRLEHGVPVRAVACTGPKAKKNLLATATSTGVVRVWDLDTLSPKSTPELLTKDDEKSRHRGAVSTLAFNTDGTLLATAGEDSAICVWNVPQAKLLTRKGAAHKSQITSLAFAPDGRLVSAGRDGRLAVWKLEDEKLSELDRVPGRSAEVGVLGLDPTGSSVLFDEGRELRVLSLDGRRIEGSLVNPGAMGTFAHMALFSPDGRTIMTNGNAPGRLQLWRAPSATNRAAELRQLLWASGIATCGAFDPAGQFAVTGTTDSKVLVWDLPRKDEAEDPLPAHLTYTEEFLDTGLKQLTVKATLTNAPDWVIPGSAATIVLPATPPE